MTGKQHVLDSRIANTFYVVVAERLKKPVDHQPDKQHAAGVPNVRVPDTIKYSFDPMEAFDKRGGSQPSQYAQQSKKQKGTERCCVMGQICQNRHPKGRLHPK